MEIAVSALAFMGALLAGALLGWIIRTRTMLPLVRETETERDLARAELQVQAIMLQDEKIARAGAESTGKRVPQLEAEIAQLRASQAELIRHEGEYGTVTTRLLVLEAEVGEERKKVRELIAEKTRLETEYGAQQQAFAEKVASLTAIRTEIEREIKNLAGEALKDSQESFLALANQAFEKHSNNAAADLEQRRVSIQALLSPLANTLDLYRVGLSELEKARQEAYGGISTELKSLAQGQTAVRLETSRLVNALRAAPTTRGRWGEHQLQNVLELAGMAPYVDYSTQQTFVRGDESLRPDAIVRLPGGRHIIIDAKTSLSGYLDAVDSLDDQARDAHLHNHARQVRQHVKQLAAKEYWDALTDTPDFVVMFVPGDNFFAAAMERDPKLFEDAINQRVLITTPTTLVALAKAIAFGWRQEKVAENARHVADLGRELYKRLQKMGGIVADLGKSLEKTVKNYNGFVGSLESSVMPQARRFNQLEVQGAQQPLPELGSLDAAVRGVQAGRDLLLPENSGEQPLTAAA